MTLIAFSHPVQLRLREEQVTQATSAPVALSPADELEELQVRIARNSDMVRALTVDSRMAVERMREMRGQYVQQIAMQN